MKKGLCTILMLLSVYGLFAQAEDKYMAAMKARVEVLDQHATPQQWLESSNAFQRIADAEQTKWLPYYYASLGQVMYGFMSMGQGGNPEYSDPIADKAEELLNKASALTEPNAELEILKKMIANLRMMGDPMTRWQTYGAIGQEAMAKARKMSPDNPRLFLLEAQDKFYTPKEFGGGRELAKPIFDSALVKYEQFKPESPIHPNWGLSQVKYFLSQY